MKRQGKPSAALVVEALRQEHPDQHALVWLEWSQCDSGWSVREQLEEHCRFVRYLHVCRNIANAGMRAAAEALDGVPEPLDYISRQESAFGSAISSRDVSSGDEEMLEGMDVTIGTIAATHGGFSGKSSGLANLDRYVGGFKPAHLYVVAGRPGMGKSAFAAQLALEMCAPDEYMQCMSAEMTPHQMRVRMLSAATGIDSNDIRDNNMTIQEAEALDRAAQTLRTIGFGWIRGPKTVENVVRAARSAKRKKKRMAGLLVDYMQMLDTEKPFRDEEPRIAYVCKTLRFLADDLECPVIGVCQLNREVEKRANMRPQISDIRGSGQIGANQLQLDNRAVHHASLPARVLPAGQPGRG